MIFVICRGLPGSGKTTKALQWLAEDPTNRARVNRDDLRAMIYNGVWHGKEGEYAIRAVSHASIRLLLSLNLSVICDDTNLSPTVVEDLTALALSLGAVTEVWDLTTVPLDECIRRDAARENPVGSKVIREMNDTWVIEH